MSKKITKAQACRIKKVISATEQRKKNIIQERSKRFLKTMRSDVWTCDFGQNVGGEINGIRPCIIIQNDTENETSRNTIVLPIQLFETTDGQSILIEPTDIEQVEGNLNGFALPNQIQVISKAKLGRKIAKMTDNAMVKIGDHVRSAMGL